MPFRAVTVDTTVVELAGYNPARKTLAIANNGAATIFFSGDRSNILTQGFPLGVGQVMVLAREDGDEPEAPLYSTVSAGTVDVRVEESLGP